MKRVAAIAAAALFLALVVNAPAATGLDREPRPPCAVACPIPVRAIQAELDAAVAAGVPGVVWLDRSGTDTVVLTAGTANLTTGRPMLPDDRFRVASITKMFVATVVLQLVQEHRLQLDDPLERWLPGAITDHTITIRQLLQHTSGLYDFGDDGSFLTAAVNDPTRSWTPTELVAIATAHPPYFAPGAGIHYSNTGYVLLGMLIERITGRREPDEIARRLLRPLHLEHTYVSHESTIRGRHAHGYTSGPAGQPVDVTLHNATLTGASGDIISTVTDIATFQRTLLAGRLLNHTLLAAMETFAPTDDPATSIGLGLFATTQACGTSYGHGGGIFGFSSDAQQTADNRHQFVVFTNTDSIPDAAYPHLGAATVLGLCDPPAATAQTS